MDKEDISAEPDSGSEDGSAIIQLLNSEEPTDNVSLAVGILDQIDQALEMNRLLDRAVDEAIGLKPSQTSALKAIADGSSDLDSVSARLGLIGSAAGSTVESLIDSGFVVRSADDGLHLTETGRATMDRADAIRLRSADLASTRLSEHQLSELVGRLGLGLSSERQLRRA